MRTLVGVAALAAMAEGFTIVHPTWCNSFLGRKSMQLCSAGRSAPALRASARLASRPGRGLAMQTGEKSASQQIIIGILAFGFLFGALFPLINNGLRVGTAGQEMSGAATGMRQKELDERLSKVRRSFLCTARCTRKYLIASDRRVATISIHICACVCAKTQAQGNFRYHTTTVRLCCIPRRCCARPCWRANRQDSLHTFSVAGPGIRCDQRRRHAVCCRVRRQEQGVLLPGPGRCRILCRSCQGAARQQSLCRYRPAPPCLIPSMTQPCAGGLRDFAFCMCVLCCVFHAVLSARCASDDLGRRHQVCQEQPRQGRPV